MERRDSPGSKPWAPVDASAYAIDQLPKSCRPSSGNPQGQSVVYEILKGTARRRNCVAVETNGSILAPDELDWICVSPKAGASLQQQTGNELKLVYPQAGADPDQFRHLDFEHFFLQPMDGANVVGNTRLAIEYCKQNPRWRLSLQTHKLLGIP